MCETITANQKMIKQLEKYQGKLVNAKQTSNALKLYLSNLAHQAKWAKNALQDIQTTHHVSYRDNVLDLLNSQKVANVKFSNPTPYLNKLKSEKVVGRNAIEKFVRIVNTKSLKKARQIENIMSNYLVPKITNDWSTEFRNKIKQCNHDMIADYKAHTSKFIKTVLHPKYLKSIQQIKNANRKMYKKILHERLVKLHRCFTQYRGVNSITDNFIDSGAWFVHNCPKTLNTELFFIKNTPTQVIKDTFESGLDFFSNFTYDEKANQILFNGKKSFKYATNFFKLLVLEDKLVYLPYLKSTKTITTQQCFASDLNVVNVFNKHGFFFGNQSHLRTDDLYSDYFVMGFQQYKPSDLPTHFNIISNQQAWIDYHTFVEK